jgi:hypothetical protein
MRDFSSPTAAASWVKTDDEQMERDHHRDPPGEIKIKAHEPHAGLPSKAKSAFLEHA